MNDKTGLYIQMFSVHGLLRADNMELGHDADTGGQINYVVELCRTLSAHPGVRKVDLFTRLIQDKTCSDDYARPVERVNDTFRILRIQCGGRKYIRKELLWPLLDEFVDKTVKFIRKERDIPDIVHGHYADGGYVARELAGFFGVPFVFTGHSLGKTKKERLLAQGADKEELNRKFRIDHRIEVEERLLAAADLVVTSTGQEKEEQFGLYANQALPCYAVIPPGIDLDRFYPFYHDRFPDSREREKTLFARASITRELERFFQHPDRPMILMLCRPDKRKNIQGLVKAYGESPELQAMANLAVFAGIRKDISEKEDSERDVLTDMLLLLDRYNLYGKMAIPKKHDFEIEVPELYRIAALKRGVFVNPALTEPFGLTLLEALACGLPIVATDNGGPRDIVANCDSGTLVDPRNTTAIAGAIRDILVHPETWETYSRNGILKTREVYSWQNHAATYLKQMSALRSGKVIRSAQAERLPAAVGKKFSAFDTLLVTDIDNTLIGGPARDRAALMDLLEKQSGKVGFGVATGRMFDSTLDILKTNGIPLPDVIVSCVGSQINYGPSLSPDRGWETHISREWKPAGIKACMESLDFVRPQEPGVQGAFKLSYIMEPGQNRLARIHDLLTRNRLRYSLIYSHQRYLDILPFRASKGKAVRYLSYKWEIPLNRFLVCGDSGNDAEMLSGDTRGVVVANYSPELESLKSNRTVYFSKKGHAAGIMDGMRRYGLIPEPQRT
jgi:sucrose-phosphate synthase